MLFQDMFREEFYEEFKDYPASIVVKALKLMSKARMSSFYVYYKKGSNMSLDNKVAKELINNLKNSIDENFAKKRFSQVFKTYNLSTIKSYFGMLSLHAQTSLLKEYTFNETFTEYVSNLSESDSLKNQVYIKQLRDMFENKVGFYMPFFELFKAPRAILLLAVILLNENDKKLLVMKYDENLCGTQRKPGISSKIGKCVNDNVVPKIRKNIEKIYAFIPAKLLESIESMFSRIDTSQIFTNKDLVMRVNSLVGDYFYKINIHRLFPNISEDVLESLYRELSKKEKNALRCEYSFDDNDIRSVVTDEVRNLNKQTLDKLKKWMNLYLEYKNFYKFFRVKRDIVINIISQLNSKDIEFLMNMYNNGYAGGPNTSMIVYKKNREYLKRIIGKIQHNIVLKTNRETVKLTIFDIVRVKDLNVIKNACDKLCILEYMEELFGQNLDGIVEIPVSSLSKFMMSSFVYRLNSQIENKTIQQKSISIYEYYIDFKRENETVQEFKSRVNGVIIGINSKKVKTVLFNRFYNDVKDLIDVQDVDNTNNINMSHANNMITNKLALQNLHYARERGLDYKEPVFDKRSLFLVESFYDGVSLDDVKRELALCDESPIELFKLKFGENLDERGKVGEFNSKELWLMQKTITKINKKLYLKDLLLNSIDKFKTTVEFAILREEFSEIECLVIMSKKYFADYLNVQDVMDYLETSNSLRKMQ